MWLESVADYIESRVGVKTVTAAYTVEANIFYVRVDLTSGAITVTLPLAAGKDGRRIRVYKVSSDANILTLGVTGSDTINGVSTQTVTSQYSGWEVVSNGNAAWEIIGSAGVGTVTNTGTLTASNIILGNGTTDVKALGDLGSSTKVLHGNAAGDPTWGQVSLSADVTGTLPFANLATLSASRLLGRGSAGGTGVPEEITLGTNLSMSTTTLNADASLTGTTDDSTYASFAYPLWKKAATGAVAEFVSSTKWVFKPSTGEMQWIGSLTLLYNGSHSFKLVPASSGGQNTYTWPPAPINGYVLTTDGSGVLSWTVGGGGGGAGTVTNTGTLTSGSVVLGNGGADIHVLTPGTTSQFLRGDSTWATPAGAGTVTHTAGNLTASAVMVGNAVDDSKTIDAFKFYDANTQVNAAGSATVYGRNTHSQATWTSTTSASINYFGIQAMGLDSVVLSGGTNAQRWATAVSGTVIVAYSATAAGMANSHFQFDNRVGYITTDVTDVTGTISYNGGHPSSFGYMLYTNDANYQEMGGYGVSLRSESAGHLIEGGNFGVQDYVTNTGTAVDAYMTGLQINVNKNKAANTYASIGVNVQATGSVASGFYPQAAYAVSGGFQWGLDLSGFTIGTVSGAADILFPNSHAIISNATRLTIKSGAYTFGLPIADGTNGQFLKTDGAGTWSFATPGGGGGTPGGSDTYVQFNDAGTFGGVASLTFNKTTGSLTLSNSYAGAKILVVDNTSISASAQSVFSFLVGAQGLIINQQSAAGGGKTLMYSDSTGGIDLYTSAATPLGFGTNTSTDDLVIDTSHNTTINGTLKLGGSSSGFVGLKGAAAAGSTTYTLPTADGTKGYALHSDGAATLSWQDPGGINVVMYGADPTGSADSLSAIQAAIDAVGTSGHVYFPKGTYKITNAIRIGSNIKMSGDGYASQISYAGTGGVTVDWLIGGSGTAWFMVLNENGHQRAGTVDTNIEICHLRFTYTSGTSPHTILLMNTTDCSVHHCYQDGGAADLCSFLKSKYYRVTDNYSTGNVNCAYDNWDGPSHAVIANNVAVVGNGGSGIFVNGVATDTTTPTNNDGFNISITGNTIVAGHTGCLQGIYISGLIGSSTVKYVTVTGNVIKSDGSNVFQRGIDVRMGNFVTVIGNIVVGPCTLNGIEITSDYNTITGNIVTDVTGVGDYGIEVTGNYNRMSDNILYNNTADWNITGTGNAKNRADYLDDFSSSGAHGYGFTGGIISVGSNAPTLGSLPAGTGSSTNGWQKFIIDGNNYWIPGWAV